MKHFFTRLRFFLVASIWLLCPLLSRAQSWQSAIALPAIGGNSTVYDIVSDGTGGYILAGEFKGTLTLGSFTLVNTDGDIFVARLNSTGVWTQAVKGGAGNKKVKAIALDTNGGVVVAGQFNGLSTTFGTITLTNSSALASQNSDIFVARLNAAGQWTQAVRAGGSDQDITADLAVDASGTATVVGYFTGGNATFGSKVLARASESGALFVARLTSAGMWSQALASTYGGPNYATGVALDASGNAAVCGYYFSGGNFTLGTITLTSYTGAATAFVARLSRSGVWTQAVQADNGHGFAAAGTIAMDASGNVVVAGNFRDADVSFGPYRLTYTPSGDNLFVARLNSAGTWTQAAQALNSGNSYPQGITLDASGSTWVTGTFYSPTIRFGSTTLTNPSTTPDPIRGILNTDIFVARLDASGSWTYAAQAGGLDIDFPTEVLSNGNDIFVTGRFGPTAASFGSTTLTTLGNSTGFLARLGGSTLSAAHTSKVAGFIIAPNPATGSALLTLTAASTPCLIQIFDALGRVARSQLVPARTTLTKLDIASLQPGMYTVHCGSGTQRLAIE
jgi:hypothetical protein